MKAALVLVSLSVVSLSVWSAPVKFKTLAELQFSNQGHLVCQSRGAEAIHLTVDLAGSPGGNPDKLELAILRPGESLYTRRYDGGFGSGIGQVTWRYNFSSIPWTISAESYSGSPSDIVSLEVSDATNGKFKGKVVYSRNDVAMNVRIEKDVTCGGYNYSFPKPE